MSQLKVTTEVWAGIPLLHCDADSLSAASPIAIFWHGFTSAKEHNLHYAFRLVQRGVRVLLPDAALHGAREEGLAEAELEMRFWEIVLQSIRDTRALHEELERRGWSGPVGLGGTSMGGIVTCGCLTAYPWIRAAAILMGTPAYVEMAGRQIAQLERAGMDVPLTGEERERFEGALARFDLTRQPEAVGGRPLFFWHGKRDQTVPYGPTHAFYESLAPEQARSIQFMTDARAGHSVTRTGMLAATDWLAKHLTDKEEM